MRAVVITQYGGPEVLAVREVPDPPSPSANQVTVRVRAAALNRADLLQRLGRYPAPAGFPPDIPGLEFAGEVLATGPEVQRWKSGQRVFGITGGGAQAELVITPEDQLAEVPPNLNWIQAAAVPEVFITAHDALFATASLQAGESVLIHAAGSGVGTAAIQLARAAGAKVFGTARTAAKLEQAAHLGLSASIAVGDPSSIVEAVRDWTKGEGVDVVLDLVGAAYLDANLRSLAKRGRMVLVGTTAGAKGTLEFGLVMSKRLKIIGTVLRSRSAEEKASATQQFQREVVPLLAAGSVRPIVDSTFRLEEVAAAHQRLESNATFGKVVLEIS